MAQSLEPVAIGGDLEVETLLYAYRHGVFPWYSAGQPIMWWSPEPRMVLQTANFKLHRSLAKTLRRFRSKVDCEVRINTHFTGVIQACAQTPREGQGGTWITEEMQAAYTALHRAGYAHSVETWVQGVMVGGLYCVAIGHAVFGESMFSHASDASKIALAGLVAFCREQGVTLIDCQQETHHLASLGALPINRSDFLAHIVTAQNKATLAWTSTPRIEETHWLQLSSDEMG